MKVTIKKDNEKAQEFDCDLMFCFYVADGGESYLTTMRALTDDDKSEEEFAIAQRATLIAMCELISMSCVKSGRLTSLMGQAIDVLKERTEIEDQ